MQAMMRSAVDPKTNQRVFTEDEVNLLTDGVALNGTQNLARGVCLYTSEVKDGETSQMMVGVAEGERSVNVKMTLTLDFEIEDSIVETYRMWRSEVPVDSIPETGDKYTKYLLLFVLSGAALCAFVMLRRRKRADV